MFFYTHWMKNYYSEELNKQSRKIVYIPYNVYFIPNRLRCMSVWSIHFYVHMYIILPPGYLRIFVPVGLALTGYELPQNIYAFYIVFVLPITAIVNPLIYTYKGTVEDSIYVFVLCRRNIRLSVSMRIHNTKKSVVCICIVYSKGNIIIWEKALVMLYNFR